MQRSIVEVEDLLKRKMSQHTEQKIVEVHQRLDIFELRVLAQPAPLVDVSTLQAAVEILREELDICEYEMSLLGKLVNPCPV